MASVDNETVVGDVEGDVITPVIVLCSRLLLRSLPDVGKLSLIVVVVGLSVDVAV